MSIRNLVNMVNTTMPYAWDDSLSVYEMLGKLISKINEVVNEVNIKLPDDFEIAFYEKFREYTREEMQSILESGEFAGILDSMIVEFSPIKQEVIDARQGALSVGENISEVKSQLAEIATHIKPTGTTNDSTNINSLLESGGSFVVKKGTYQIVEDIIVKSNTEITFEQGAVFQKTPTDSSNFYIVLSVYNVDNVTINAPQIIGDKENHIGAGEEHGHGISIRNSDKITVNNPLIKDCWGDGIYIGHAYSDTVGKKTGTVRIINPIIDGVRRNGIAICGGKEIFIENPIIKNVIETAPMSAIDIEPEGGGTLITPFLENVTINNLIVDNCTFGFNIFLEQMKDRGLNTVINVNKANMYNTNQPLLLSALTGALSGEININDLSSYNSRGGIQIIDYKADNTPVVCINRPKIINFNTHNGYNDTYNAGISIIRFSDSINTYPIGNVRIIEPFIQRDTSFSSFYGRNFYFKDLKNVDSADYIKKVHIIDPIELNTQGINVSTANVIYSNDITISDKYKKMTYRSSSATIKYNEIFKTYHNKGLNYCTLTLENYPNGEEITFEVLDAVALTIIPKPDSTILPSYRLGKYIASSVIGSRIKLRKVGVNWHIVEQIGTWTEQT